MINIVAGWGKPHVPDRWSHLRPALNLSLPPPSRHRRVRVGWRREGWTRLPSRSHKPPSKNPLKALLRQRSWEFLPIPAIWFIHTHDLTLEQLSFLDDECRWREQSKAGSTLIKGYAEGSFFFFEECLHTLTSIFISFINSRSYVMRLFILTILNWKFN